MIEFAFDLGNTRIKWNAVQRQKKLGGGVLSYGEALDALKALAAGESLLARIACVASEDRKTHFIQQLQEELGVAPDCILTASVKPECAGVVQAYEDHTRLGVDRWLALLAVHNDVNRSPDVASVIVSAGTALTVDLLTAEGVHLGGYIVPGLNLMREALFAGTNAVKIDFLAPSEKLSPGQSTQAAVANGILLMVKGLVNQAQQQLSEHAKVVQLVVCGGDGEIIQRYFEDSVFSADLVMDGLQFALPLH